MEIMNSALLDLLEKINLFYLNFILIYLKVFGTDFFFFFFPSGEASFILLCWEGSAVTQGKKNTNWNTAGLNFKISMKMCWINEYLSLQYSFLDYL